MYQAFLFGVSREGVIGAFDQLLGARCDCLGSADKTVGPLGILPVQMLGLKVPASSQAFLLAQKN